ITGAESPPCATHGVRTNFACVACVSRVLIALEYTSATVAGVGRSTLLWFDLVPRGNLEHVNRYLVTASGRFVGSRAGPFAVGFGPILLGPLFGLAAGVAAVAGAPALAVLLGLLGGLSLFGGLVLAWVLLLRGSGAAARASAAWLAGDVAAAVPLCQSALGTVYRADVRSRALHVLGLTAEANGDFAEAA